MRLPLKNNMILVCSPADLRDNHEELHRYKSHFINGFAFFEIDENEFLPEGSSLEHIFECFYRPASRQTVQERQSMLDALFEDAADHYEQIADTKRNCENIRNLINVIRLRHAPASPPLRILDVGSGTGLSKLAVSDQDLELFGIERCPVMRNLAMKRNLESWHPDDTTVMEKESFDGAFASYLLHLKPDPAVFASVWRLLKSGSIFCGNFLKDLGVAEADFAMSSFGAIPVRLPEGIGGIHGTVRAYLKK